RKLSRPPAKPSATVAMRRVAGPRKPPRKPDSHSLALMHTPVDRHRRQRRSGRRTRILAAVPAIRPGPDTYESAGSHLHGPAGRTVPPPRTKPERHHRMLAAPSDEREQSHARTIRQAPARPGHPGLRHAFDRGRRLRLRLPVSRAFAAQPLRSAVRRVGAGRAGALLRRRARPAADSAAAERVRTPTRATPAPAGRLA